MRTILKTLLIFALLGFGCGGEQDLTRTENRDAAEKTARMAAQKLTGTLLG